MRRESLNLEHIIERNARNMSPVKSEMIFYHQQPTQVHGTGVTGDLYVKCKGAIRCHRYILPLAA